MMLEFHNFHRMKLAESVVGCLWVDRWLRIGIEATRVSGFAVARV
jgi:hypothetical protein